jgi:hypothetical protein
MSKFAKAIRYLLPDIKSKLRWTGEAQEALSVFSRYITFHRVKSTNIVSFLEQNRFTYEVMDYKRGNDEISIWVTVEGPTIWSKMIPFATQHQFSLKLTNSNSISIDHFLWVNHF